MKRFIRNKDLQIIDIEIVLDYADEDIAAANLIQHPKNIAKKRKINEKKLQILDDMAMSVISMINYRPHLRLKDHYQASNSYSYYIEFNVVDDEGVLIVPVGIRFRISNHKMSGDPTPTTSKQVIIRSSVLKGRQYENSVEIIMKISNVLDELDQGNISVLDQVV